MNGGVRSKKFRFNQHSLGFLPSESKMTLAGDARAFFAGKQVRWEKRTDFAKKVCRKCVFVDAWSDELGFPV